MADKTNTIQGTGPESLCYYRIHYASVSNKNINMGSIDYWFGSYQFTNAILRRRNAKRF